jgi:hypothetical protein
MSIIPGIVTCMEIFKTLFLQSFTRNKKMKFYPDNYSPANSFECPTTEKYIDGCGLSWFKVCLMDVIVSGYCNTYKYKSDRRNFQQYPVLATAMHDVGRSQQSQVDFLPDDLLSFRTFCIQAGVVQSPHFDDKKNQRVVNRNSRREKKRRYMISFAKKIIEKAFSQEELKNVEATSDQAEQLESCIALIDSKSIGFEGVVRKAFDSVKEYYSILEKSNKLNIVRDKISILTNQKRTNLFSRKENKIAKGKCHKVSHSRKVSSQSTKSNQMMDRQTANEV